MKVGDKDIEGDPLVLARARTKNYPQRKICVSSTPTIEVASPIRSLFLEGTREKWAWPTETERWTETTRCPGP